MYLFTSNNELYIIQLNRGGEDTFSSLDDNHPLHRGVLESSSFSKAAFDFWAMAKVFFGGYNIVLDDMHDTTYGGSGPKRKRTEEAPRRLQEVC